MTNRLTIVAILLVAVSGSAQQKKSSIPPTITSPQIVAKVVQVGRTTAIPLTAIFTPAQDGLYRISAYLALTTGGGTYNGITFNLFWRDDTGNRTISPLNLSDTPYPSIAWGPANNLDGVFTFRANAGRSISYDVEFSQPPPTGTYELLFTIEQLI